MFLVLRRQAKKMSTFIKSQLLFCLLCVSLSSAHVRMVCPRPVSPRSDIATVPSDFGKDKCLSGGQKEQDVLEIHPGLFTIRFEETKFMAGSPFRVLLLNALSATLNGHGDNDLRREKRDVHDTTTDTSLSVQNAIDKMNGTLHSIDSNSMSNDTNSTMTHDVENGNTTMGTNVNSTDEISSVTTETTAQFESSTASSTSAPSTKSSVQKDNTTKKTEEKDTSGDGKGKPQPSGDLHDQHCVLMDHIPHNDQVVVSDNCLNNGNSFPLGVCEESTYYVTIRIPDINCPDCFLVVQQIEALPDHKVCDASVSAVNQSECISYVSCSRIRIMSSLEGENRDMSQCSNYLDNLPDDWVYRPQDLYKIGDNAVLTMDLLHRDLHIEIMRGLPIGPTERVEIRYDQLIIWNATALDGHMNADSLLFVWSNVPDSYQTLLKKNKLVLNIISPTRSLASDIVFTSQIFSEGQLSSLHDIYSSHGWLVANRFLGPSAKDPMAALPIGPCVPPARHFLAYFEAIDAGDHGLLGMTLLDNRAYITAVLHVQLGTVQAIRFKGSELVGAEDIVVQVPESFSGVFQVALDVTQQMKFIDSVQFLKTVEVKTNREDAILVGDIEEGFYTVLRDQKGRVRGMGAFLPTQGYWMHAEIVLSDLSDSSPNINTAKILGMGIHDIELMDLSKETIHCTQKFCCLESYVHELTSEFFLHLLSGQARLEVTTVSDVMSGQIVGSNHCAEDKGLCLMTDSFSKNTALTEKYGGTVSAVVMLDRAEVLEISVQVSHPEWDWAGNYTAYLSAHSGSSVKIPLHFSWLSGEFHAAKERFPMATSKKTMMMVFEKKMHLRISNGIHTLMNHKVYGWGRKECIQSKMHVIGQGQNSRSPLDKIYAVVLDHIKFMFDNNTALYLMKSKAAYDKCDFTNAKKINTSNWIGGMRVYIYMLTTPGLLYFADKVSCVSNSDPVAKWTVQVVKGKESLVQDRSREDWCRTSFYMVWRHDQLEKWDPPSVSGPVVLGLFLGLITATGFLLWQGRKMKQTPSTSASRNSLSHFVRF